MLNHKTVHCEPYERPWRDRAVDRNLEDQCLERLNNLDTLDLASICEGHADARPPSVKRSPRIVLMFKKAYKRPLTEQWYDLKEDLAAAIERIWPDKETRIEFEILHRNDNPAEEIEDLIIRIISERKRDTILLPEWANHWFGQNLWRIETFDRLMKTIIIIKEDQQ